MILTVNGEYSRVKFCRYYKKQQILRITNPRTIPLSVKTSIVLYVICSSGGSRIFAGGGRQSSWGAPGYEFIKCSRKLHEIEKNLAAGGVPPRSANVLCSENFDYVVVVILSEGIDVCNV